MTLSASATLAADSLVQRALLAIEGGGSRVYPPPASVEVAFSPDGGTTEMIVREIGAAKRSIRIAAYAFTSRPVAKALVAAHRAGVDVKIVVDHGQIEKSNHSETAYLAKHDIPVRIDIVHTLQHDKYMVIDGKDVETGSFNYTAAAEHHNSENAIILRDAPKLAAAYADNWKSLWDAAESYSGK